MLFSPAFPDRNRHGSAWIFFVLVRQMRLPDCQKLDRTNAIPVHQYDRKNSKVGEIPGMQKHLTRFFRSIALPAIGLAVVALIHWLLPCGNDTIAYLNQAVQIGYILLGLSLAFRLFCTVALDILLARATGRQVPKILKHLIGVAVVVLGVLLSVNVVFSGAFTGLIALSSIVAVVIGLALRPIILDIFSGLSANLDAAFHIGDWIEINGRSGAGSYTGWVEEINWRTTHLKTRSGNLVICPNSTISTAIITNCSRPTPLSRYDISVKLPPEIEPDRTRRILTAAVEATMGTENGPASAKAPEVLISELDASGVEYRIRFWLDPAKNSCDLAIDKVLRSALRHLQLAGIPLAENVILQRDSRTILDSADVSARAEVLGRTALFSGVLPAPLEQLAQNTSLHSFVRGDTLIRQGGEDNDMFLLFEGAVDVLITVDDKEVAVTRMQAGDYFGEMSLLTGEPRTATIRAATAGAAYRISRDAVTPVLESNVALMDLLSHNLAERNLGRQAAAAASQDQSPEQKRESLAAVLLAKMLGIFRM